MELACAYWNSRRLNSHADKNDIRAITKRINGGYNGLADRKTKFSKAWKIWGTPAKNPWFAERPTIRRGDNGPAARKLQKHLNIVSDGIFGPATERAVKAYQRRKGLTPDGIVGPNTWAKLIGE